jgi:GDP-4-dehydro-6-deoxy-D-mannose reductase
MLDKLLQASRIEVRVETDPARLRPSDVEVLLGDYSKFRADTGWEPRIPFYRTLADLLDYWRQRVASGRG